MRVRKRDYEDKGKQYPIYGYPYFTKPKNHERFFEGWIEDRLEYVSFRNPGYDILLLREDACKALEARIIGKLDYDAATDIDRYMVDCLASDSINESCPVFEELKRWIGELKNRVAAGADQDAPDGDGATYIDDGDGSVGPIAPHPNGGVDFRKKGPELDAICANCIYRRDNAANGGESGKQAIGPVKHEGIIAKITKSFAKKG